MRETPASSLAKRITDRLVKEKLLAPDRADQFSLSLASGKLKEGDWRFELEPVQKPKKKSTKER
jgi:hypothetical protein